MCESMDVDYSREKSVVIVLEQVSEPGFKGYTSQKIVIGNYVWWINVHLSSFLIESFIVCRMHCESRKDKWTLKCEYAVQLVEKGITPLSYHSNIEFAPGRTSHSLQSWNSSEIQQFITSKDEIVVEVTVKFSPGEEGDPFAGVNETMYQLPKWTKMLLNNPFLSDVEFIVGSSDTQRQFFGHKHVLANASSVFRKMLFPPKESAGTSPTEINLPDVDSTAFMTMLRFVYKRETIVHRNKFRETLILAQEYSVNGFPESLEFYLDKESVTDVLPFILQIGRQHILWNKTWDVVKIDIKDIIKQEGFLKLPQNVIQKILEQDELNIKEIDLWNAYVKWADAQCIAKYAFIDDINREKFMKDIDLIRFPTMTAEEFASGPAKSNILSSEDKVSIFNYFLTKSNTKFNGNKRKARVTKVDFISGRRVIPKR